MRWQVPVPQQSCYEARWPGTGLQGPAWWVLPPTAQKSLLVATTKSMLSMIFLKQLFGVKYLISKMLVHDKHPQIGVVIQWV